jgi:hypothetical protein
VADVEHLFVGAPAGSSASNQDRCERLMHTTRKGVNMEWADRDRLKGMVLSIQAEEGLSKAEMLEMLRILAQYVIDETRD